MDAAPQPNAALEGAIAESGLRKDWIARRVGVSKSHLSKWLSGERTPSLVQREKLALLLNRDAEDFVCPAYVVGANHTGGSSHDGEVSALPTPPRTERGDDLPEAA